MIRSQSRKIFNLCMKLRNAVSCEIEVAGLRFHPTNKEEYSRYSTLLTKEPGTVDWIRKNVRFGDVFYDVGANLGLFSLLAAKCGALVYAFEPHKTNFCSLIKNSDTNYLRDYITPCSIALSNKTGLEVFYYKSTNNGSSMNQLGDPVNLYDNARTPAFAELLQSARIDDLINYGLPAPHLVKLDVDGHELKILEGARELLSSNARPRSLSIEINIGSRESIDAFMREYHYIKESVNYSSSERAWKEKYGEDAPHNAIYTNLKS